MHEQHRERVKTRFLKDGIDGFEPHNVIELLLFYSIPRRDTNEIAHRLINRFGSVSGVLEADYDDLVSVDGVGEHSASLIKLIPQLARRYMTELTSVDKTFDTAKKIGDYFVAKFLGQTVESVQMLMLTASYGVIACEEIHRGSVNSSQITIRSIIERAITSRASMVVLAHNHPGGLAIPSAEDINTTRLIHEALSIIDCRLLEHFVVAEGRFMPIMSRTGALGTLNQSLGDDELRRFYGEV